MSASASIEADRGRVRQILNNLVTNALEALEGVAVAAARDRHAARAGRRCRVRGRDRVRQWAGLPARAAGPGVRSLRHEQAQGHRPRARHRQENRRRARRTHRRRQSSRRRRARARGAADERQHAVGFELARPARPSCGGNGHEYGTHPGGRRRGGHPHVSSRRFSPRKATRWTSPPTPCRRAPRAHAADARSRAARHLDAGRRWHHAAARVVRPPAPTAVRSS